LLADGVATPDERSSLPEERQMEENIVRVLRWFTSISRRASAGLVTLLSGLVLMGCSSQGQAPPEGPTTQSPAPPGAIQIRETTNPIISGHEVAPANIFDRELPGPDGVVTQRMSAVVSLMDRATQREWSETVIVGSQITLGTDRYRVHAIEPGTQGPGFMTLVKVAP